MQHGQCGRCSRLKAPRSCRCLYCCQDVYRSTYPGNSLCTFTEICSDSLTACRRFQRREHTPQVDLSLGCPDHTAASVQSGQTKLKSALLTFHYTRRYNVNVNLKSTDSRSVVWENVQYYLKLVLIWQWWCCVRYLTGLHWMQWRMHKRGELRQVHSNPMI